MERARIVFFGTPDFAVPTAAALRRSGRSPVLVVSQPARPAGRGCKLTQTPVARWAEELDLPLAQPESVRERDFLRQLRELAPDLAVVVAFGQIFRRSLLELPAHGCLNLHASLLPAYRGAAPIQAALADGLERTGVTTMKMERGLDSGPIYQQREIRIGPTETAVELSPRLAELGAELVVETVGAIERGEAELLVQDEARASYAPRIRKSDGIVDWKLPAERLVNLERAYSPWPGLSSSYGGESVKVAGLRVVDAPGPFAAPGTWPPADGERLVVACGDGSAVEVGRVQRAGRRPVRAAEFLRGLRGAAPRCFGELR